MMYAHPYSTSFRAAEPHEFLVWERGWQVPEAHVLEMWNREAVAGKVFLTITGEEVKIIFPGKRNLRAGADFTGAIIEHRGEILRGEIELHRTQRDWFAHRHHLDERYRSVILHVVFSQDLRIPEDISTGIPTVNLSQQLFRPISQVWDAARSDQSFRNANVLACQEFSASVSENAKRAMLHVSAASRFSRKTRSVALRYETLRSVLRKGDTPSIPMTEIWMQILYEMIFSSFGYGGNKEAMRQLAQRLPLRWWQLHEKEFHTTDRIYLLLLGVAGLIDRAQMDEAAKDQALVHWLEWKKRFAFQSIEKTAWNYGRVRPQNMPHERLKSIAILLPFFRDRAWFRVLGETVLQATKANGFHHGKLSACFAIQPSDTNDHAIHAAFGEERRHEIIVNVIAPFFAALGMCTGRNDLYRRAVDMYFQFPSKAKNSVTQCVSRALQLSCETQSGLQQGMLEVHEAHCTSRECAACFIGAFRT